MLIMGIDPGTAITGLGVIEKRADRLSPVGFECIRTPANLSLDKRLALIYDGILHALRQNDISCVAVEEVFFNKNTRTAMAVGHARGVALLAAANTGIPVFEYTPLQVKLALVGYGRASKNQVQEMVRVILGLRDIPRPDDAADALGIAVCHAHSCDMLNRGRVEKT